MAACGKHIYVFGGCSGHSRVNDLWRFDTHRGEWQLLQSGQAQLAKDMQAGAFTAPAASEDKVGSVCAGDTCAALTGCLWQAATDSGIPVPRGGAGLFVPNEDNVYVMCGFNGKVWCSLGRGVLVCRGCSC